MSDQPEALRLADDRPLSLDDDLYQWAIDAEDTLRRQHAEIERLREYADTLVRERNAAWAESAELRAARTHDAEQRRRLEESYRALLEFLGSSAAMRPPAAFVVEAK